MSTISTKWGSDTVSVSADWAQASAPVKGDINGGYQVADFRHSPRAALRWALWDRASADGLDAYESTPLVEAAMKAAVETSDDVARSAK